MIPITTKFLTDVDGKRIGALLDIDEYYQLLAELAELEEIRAYDTTKAVKDTPVSFEYAIAEIENQSLV